jgi:HSP20 family molecular chaperone IbpA
MEIESGPFERQVRLVEDIDPERARASLGDGLLTIELPVVEHPHTGRIVITVVSAK